MTLGTMINELIEGKNLQPKALALRWLGRWEERSGEVLAAESVINRLSNLPNDRPDSVRFFFADPARAELLLDLLGAHEELRREVVTRAAEALREQGLQPRAVINLSPFEVGPAFWMALRGLLEGDLPLTPVKVLVTEAQLDSVPFGFSWKPELCVIEDVKDQDAAFDRVAALGVQPILVVSHDRFEPVDRWAALDFDSKGERFMVQPADAFAVFARAGRLTGPAPVAYPLEEICSGAARNDLPDSSARGVRSLILELAAGGPAGVASEVRLGWARELAVPASSTAEERVEKALADAQLSVRGCTARSELDEELAIARRRPVHNPVLRLDGLYHLINVSGFTPPPATEEIVRMHVVPCVTPAIRRLRDAVASYTLDDWRDDPLLAQLLAQLGGEAEPNTELRHARAWFLHHGTRIPARGEFPEHALDRLKATLGGPVPEAELLINAWDLILGPDLDRVERDTLAHVVARSELLLRRSHQQATLTEARTEALDRARARLAEPGDNEGDDAAVGAIGIGRYREHHAVPDTDDACLENFDAGISQWDKPPSSAPVLTPLKVAPGTWDEAERWVAVCWRALRRALERGNAERFGERRVLLDLGNDLVAVAEVRAWHRFGAPRAAVPFGNQRQIGTAMVDLCTVVTHTSGADLCGPVLPQVVWIAGNGIAADVRFAPAGPLAAAGSTHLRQRLRNEPDYE